jgi:hypothetical protein
MTENVIVSNIAHSEHDQRDILTDHWSMQVQILWLFTENVCHQGGFQKRGENLNSASYCDVLLKLWDAIHRKHSGQEGYCFIMTMPYGSRDYSGNFFNTALQPGLGP